MAEIVEGLGGAERERIATLRKGGHFFWIDLDAGEVTRDQLEEVLGIAPHALDPLFNITRDTAPSQKFHADGDHVVFPFIVFVEAPDPELEDDEEAVARLQPIEVNVLVHGDFILTLHRAGPPLPTIISGYTPDGRSEQYVVYAVLDGMIATAFDALNNVSLAIEGLQVASANIGNARVRMGTLREASARLATMRRQIGPQQGVFERISQEIGQVDGLESDSRDYFDRIDAQLHRLVDGIDAASNSMAQLVDLRLNETMYWLTVVATIFLPLTFATGFFGMNFAWLVQKIHTPGAFVLLGVGIPALMTVLTYLVIRRRGSPVQQDQNSIERVVGAVRVGLSKPIPVKMSLDVARQGRRRK
jgi:magnesium transporter